MEVKPEELIDGKMYCIESYGPSGLIKKMTGIFRNDIKPLLRFDQVTVEPNKKQIGLILSPDSIHTKNEYYNKYFLMNES
jgi:hypothetical protein